MFLPENDNIECKSRGENESDKRIKIELSIPRNKKDLSQRSPLGDRCELEKKAYLINQEDLFPIDVHFKIASHRSNSQQYHHQQALTKGKRKASERFKKSNE